MSYRELADFKTLLERYKLHSAGFRSEFDERIRKWAENGSEGIITLINFDDVTRSYLHTQYLLIPEELRFHQIWYEVIQVFKHRAQDHERLVIKLVAMRETGHLPLPPLVDGSPRNDSFSDGRRLWSELPIFSPDLIEEYTTHYWDNAHYNDSQRGNLAAAVGILLSVGIYDGPALVALSLLREVLETDRPLLPTSADAHSQQEVPISVEQGIIYTENLVLCAQNALILLASNRCGAATSVPHLNYAHFPDLSAPGELAVRSGLVPSDLRGYSPGRWAFWKKRLEELEDFQGSTLAESDRADNGGSWATLSDHAGFTLTAMSTVERSTRMLG
ncbi:unnamed protein product [Clonostachys byssicola]|uniref:Uncharacterized protein n=1 Tax=Clonostachys byssicola TaxID=160290 RepID=A0A9N9XWD8_9HYPO|nr:unnamed protein product [Clonostachys byssicola]